MDFKEYEIFMKMVEHLIGECEPKKAEYWRGYRQGFRFHFEGKLEESFENHYHLLNSADDSSGDPYIDAYARGYRDGCEGLIPESADDTKE